MTKCKYFVIDYLKMMISALDWKINLNSEKYYSTKLFFTFNFSHFYLFLSPLSFKLNKSLYFQIFVWLMVSSNDLLSYSEARNLLLSSMCLYSVCNSYSIILNWYWNTIHGYVDRFCLHSLGANLWSYR